MEKTRFLRTPSSLYRVTVSYDGKDPAVIAGINGTKLRKGGYDMMDDVEVPAPSGQGVPERLPPDTKVKQAIEAFEQFVWSQRRFDEGKVKEAIRALVGPNGLNHEREKKVAVEFFASEFFQKHANKAAKQYAKTFVSQLDDPGSGPFRPLGRPLPQRTSILIGDASLGRQVKVYEVISRGESPADGKKAFLAVAAEALNVPQAKIDFGDLFGLEKAPLTALMTNKAAAERFFDTLVGLRSEGYKNFVASHVRVDGKYGTALVAINPENERMLFWHWNKG